MKHSQFLKLEDSWEEEKAIHQILSHLFLCSHSFWELRRYLLKPLQGPCWRAGLWSQGQWDRNLRSRLGKSRHTHSPPCRSEDLNTNELYKNSDTVAVPVFQMFRRETRHLDAPGSKKPCYCYPGYLGQL